MIIQIDARTGVTILDPDDFKRFEATLSGDVAPAASLLRDKVEIDGAPQHVWVLESWLREALGAGRAAALDAMIRYAESKGWRRASPPAIRAHIAPG